MKIDVSKFQVPEGEAVHLHKWPTLVKPVYHSKKDYQALLADHAARLCEQQKLLYASNSDALLVIFQAMDAAGKDGAIAHVMSAFSMNSRCRSKMVSSSESKPTMKPASTQRPLS